ncbi:MAG: hypothetical protein GY765_03880 [bacterium]|nr:hypothetical protein [bacterium]
MTISSHFDFIFASFRRFFFDGRELSLRREDKYKPLPPKKRLLFLTVMRELMWASIMPQMITTNYNHKHIILYHYAE